MQVDDISSIASCSLNEDGEAAEHPSVNCSSRDHSSSAESSSFPPWSSKQKLVIKVEVHKQEVKAYKSTVQAMYASGPFITWEQESLLTNLRLSLHISNEEHLLHLKHLSSTQPC